MGRDDCGAVQGARESRTRRQTTQPGTNTRKPRQRMTHDLTHERPGDHGTSQTDKYAARHSHRTQPARGRCLTDPPQRSGDAP